MATRYKVRVKRAYDSADSDDGTRVLVDRVWPRGVSKEKLHHDEWCKNVAPSTSLRKWYGHDQDKYGEFTKRYRSELESGDAAEAFAHIRHLAHDGPVTLLTGSKAVEISQAAVLADLLNS